jgi:two-component system, OmpR family, sensor histidine kinase ChvG
MNLKRQLLLVSLLTLVLPWAGCQFIRETESALRQSQQQMLSGTAGALAESLERYPEEFPVPLGVGETPDDQLYGHRLDTEPLIDGYFNDWPLPPDALREINGPDGAIRFVVGLRGRHVYIYAAVTDKNVVYASSSAIANVAGPPYADRVVVTSANPPMASESLVFAAEAPGAVVAYLANSFGFASAPSVRAHWQDVAGGYQLEARIPAKLLGTHLGINVFNTPSGREAGVRSTSFAGQLPATFVTTSPELLALAERLVQPGTRMLITDRNGWRIAATGSPGSAPEPTEGAVSNWLRIAYKALVEPGTEPAFAEPDPGGRERQPYIVAALEGRSSESWFRSLDSGRAIVAVAEPVRSSGEIIGSVVLQQGTDAILSLRNEGLARLMNVTIIATLLVATALLGYASWLSRRIRRLSLAAEDALEGPGLRTALPSAGSGDEIGDLSRSFSYVLGQLADYNDYLRSLASKLSHELRTPLAIVTSSLENLEHEGLEGATADYTARARDGAERLRRILNAMSEASRVEELMEHAEPELFDLREALLAAVAAYRDVYPERRFEFDCRAAGTTVRGSPELLIQMLDKLVDNAADFSSTGDTIGIALESEGTELTLSVHNPGPPLPDHMRSQLFDSMVSVRTGGDDRHLGLGLYVAKLIAEGHGGRIAAENTDGGVRFSIFLPVADANLAKVRRE